METISGTPIRLPVNLSKDSGHQMFLDIYTQTYIGHAMYSAAFSRPMGRKQLTQHEEHLSLIMHPARHTSNDATSKRIRIYTYIWANAVKFPKEDGTGPPSWFSSNWSRFMLVRFPNSGGIIPESLLPFRALQPIHAKQRHGRGSIFQSSKRQINHPKNKPK